MNRLPKHEQTEAEQFRAEQLNRMSEKCKSAIPIIAVLFLVGTILCFLKFFGIL